MQLAAAAGGRDVHMSLMSPCGVPRAGSPGLAEASASRLAIRSSWRHLGCKKSV